MSEDRLITVAIYTYEKAQIIKGILENEGIPVAIQNVNLIQPGGCIIGGTDSYSGKRSAACP